MVTATLGQWRRFRVNEGGIAPKLDLTSVSGGELGLA